MPGTVFQLRRRVCPGALHMVPAFSSFTIAKKMTETEDGVAFTSVALLVSVSLGTYDGCLK